jgi:hypothetical protein
MLETENVTNTTLRSISVYEHCLTLRRATLEQFILISITAD